MYCTIVLYYCIVKSFLRTTVYHAFFMQIKTFRFKCINWFLVTPVLIETRSFPAFYPKFCNNSIVTKKKMLTNNCFDVIYIRKSILLYRVKFVSYSLTHSLTHSLIPCVKPANYVFGHKKVQYSIAYYSIAYYSIVLEVLS